jgi:hypothetical protein
MINGQTGERFAKINWAYQTLSGNRKGDTTYKNEKTGAAGSTGTSSNKWTPPHRRAGSYSSSTQTTPSWEDFIPRYDDDQYDTSGDSFEKILSDLFVGAGAAAGVAGIGGGASIFKDFVEFLEGNVDGYGTSSDDSDLRILLSTGSVEDIGNEMDDTELVIKQLKSKLESIADDIFTQKAELGLTSRYLEKMELEEGLAELQARRDVADGYVKKAQKRLLKLQTRYKEMIVSGQNDTYATGSSGASWDDIRTEAAASTRTSRSDYSSASSSSASSDTASRSDRTSSKAKDSWMEEGFGSSGRRGSTRGSTRSRRSRSNRTASRERSAPREPSDRNETSASQPRGEYERPPYYTRSSASSTDSSAERPQTSSNTNYETKVPPHRRQSSFQSQQQEKRRLRDLIVDEEFEKLKKDLGM